ncbi:MAG: glycosyltransferase family 2 protein [Pseudomonadota bacterium]|nr:glycosyltransferase family 2 protein [Pseudomonadota bacterium]
MISADRIAIIIPALNEALRIRDVVQGALAQCGNVIVIDDGSDDATCERIADLPVVLLRHAQRMGKGACLRDGFGEALRRGFDAAITMDGDGQHSADDIPRLLDAANRHPGAIIIGARMRRRSQQPTYRRLANNFGDWGIAFALGYQVVDNQSGQRFYPAEVMALEDVPGEHFVFEAQILISAASQLGTRCVSVPIESRYKTVHSQEQFRASHFKPVRDFMRITVHITTQALRARTLRAAYRLQRQHPPIIDDPTGEFGTVFAASAAQQTGSA